MRHPSIQPRHVGARLLRALTWSVVVFVLGVFVLSMVQTNYYAITPGQATSLMTMARVTGQTTYHHGDTIDMVDVNLARLNEWQYLVAHLRSPVEFVTENQLLGPHIPASQLTAQGYLEMSDAQTQAALAALKGLGRPVRLQLTGAVVTEVLSDGPSAGVLHVGDLITRVDGDPVSTTCSVERRSAPVAVGTRLHLVVAPAHWSAAGVLTRGAPRSVVIRTAAFLQGYGPLPCAGVTHQSPSFLGIGLEVGESFAGENNVRFDTANIGGPSAGLAMTLTLVDLLSPDSVTHHVAIAATGTINAQGDVGAVGGVAEKAVAVERAGIHYFFVPAGFDARAARSVASPSLHVIAVTHLSQVLSYLAHLAASPK